MRLKRRLVHARRRHLLAGIRAGGATDATFPEPGPSGVCASIEAAMQMHSSLDRLTVAGAAQIEDTESL
jgi:hypothetical protein